MLKHIARILLLTAAFASQNAFSSIITTVGPWPYIAGSGEQHHFSSGDEVRIFQQIDLTVLNQSTDDFCSTTDCNLVAPNDQWRPDDLVWSVDLLDPNGTLTQNAYDVLFSWSDIATWQGQGFTLLNFFTDSLQGLHGPLSTGTWTATTYFEGVQSGQTQFTVPEPGSFALLLAGLMGFGMRRKKS